MFVISFFQLAIVMRKDQMVKHVMLLVYAVVKLILSMTNVMHVILAFLTFQNVKLDFKKQEKASFSNWSQFI